MLERISDRYRQSHMILGLELDDALDRSETSPRLKVLPPMSTAPGPDEVIALHELRSAIDRMLKTLMPSEAMIVRRYYGFEGDGCTYDELGQQLGISGGRIHQIIAKALRKLRHPSRCQILVPHGVLDREIERTAKARAAQAAEMIRQAEEQRAEALRQAEERRIRDDLRRRIGDEIGCPDSWWSNDRRQDIADSLDAVTNEVVTEVHSSNEVYAYLRDRLDPCWRIYEAWKRDVRRHIRDNSFVFTCGAMADGSYLVYARKDQRTWYLFEHGSEYRWIGYADAGDAVRQGRIWALDQSLDLKISR
jgi:hypothetical protein